MSTSKKIIDEISQQIKLELESAYLYMMIAEDLGKMGWKGAQHWMMLHAEEEYEHARNRGVKIY